MTKIERAVMLSVGIVVPACVGDVPGEPGEMITPADQLAPTRASGWTELDTIPYDPMAYPHHVAGDRPLHARSREELAQALRPVILKGDGKLYISREPNWEAADAIERDEIDPADAPPDQTSRVIGTDGRTLVTDTTIAPFSAIARVLITHDSGFTAQCSGAYVGPWTFVTAGHCLRQPGGTLVRRINFEPARNGSSLPLASFNCRNDDTSSANDFLAAIPAGFVLDGTDRSLDFAVIDTYPCHRAPRWFGQPAANQGVVVDSGTATYSLHGYPGDPCPGASAGFQFMCGMSGSAYVNGAWLESEHIDSSGGQSGGPWYRAGRVAGVHLDYREYFDLFRCGFDVCRRNYARRFDGTYKAFLDAVAFDYP